MQTATLDEACASTLRRLFRAEIDAITKKSNALRDALQLEEDVVPTMLSALLSHVTQSVVAKMNNTPPEALFDMIATLTRVVEANDHEARPTKKAKRDFASTTGQDAKSELALFLEARGERMPRHDLLSAHEMANGRCKGVAFDVVTGKLISMYMLYPPTSAYPLNNIDLGASKVTYSFPSNADEQAKFVNELAKLDKDSLISLNVVLTRSTDDCFRLRCKLSSVNDDDTCTLEIV